MKMKNKTLDECDRNRIMCREWFEAYKVREAVSLLKEKIQKFNEHRYSSEDWWLVINKEELFKVIDECFPVFKEVKKR